MALSIRWVTSLAPTMITATSGALDLLEGAGELSLEAGGLGPDDGDVGQADRAAGERGDAGGDDRPDGLVAVVGAHAGGGGVTEHDELDGFAGPGAVEAVVVRCPLEVHADDAPGDQGLGLEDPVADAPRAPMPAATPPPP